MTDSKANPLVDTNTLIALGAVSLVAVGGLAYWFMSGQTEEPVKPSEIEDLLKKEPTPVPEVKKIN